MNFSMQDTFNLGWKLMAVLRKQCPPELLNTYSAEPSVVAQQLIDFDKEWATMFSDRAKQGDASDEKGVDPRNSRSTSSSMAASRAWVRTLQPFGDYRPQYAPATGPRFYHRYALSLPPRWCGSRMPSRCN